MSKAITHTSAEKSQNYSPSQAIPTQNFYLSIYLLLFIYLVYLFIYNIYLFVLLIFLYSIYNICVRIFNEGTGFGKHVLIIDSRQAHSLW